MNSPNNETNYYAEAIEEALIEDLMRDIGSEVMLDTEVVKLLDFLKQAMLKSLLRAIYRRGDNAWQR